MPTLDIQLESDVDLNSFRERGAATKKFETRYYNVDIHRAGLAMPEFMKAAFPEA